MLNGQKVKTQEDVAARLRDDMKAFARSEGAKHGEVHCIWVLKRPVAMRSASSPSSSRETRPR